MKRITNVGSTDPAEEKYYFIRSSVLGKVISEADATGKKKKTFVPANGTTLATQEIFIYNGTTESLTFDHTDASGTAAQTTTASGAATSNTTYNRTGEYSPLGRNVADAGPYIQLMAYEDPDEGGVNMFGSGQGYRPGQQEYRIDGLVVPESQFMDVINSGLIGGAFGLLEMAARMSAQPPKFAGYSVGGTNYGNNLNGAIGRAIEDGLTTVFANYTIYNDTWRGLSSIIGNVRNLMDDLMLHTISYEESERIKKIKGIVEYSINPECRKAFEAAGATPIEDQLKAGLTFVTENVFSKEEWDQFWADGSNIGKEMREKYVPGAKDVTPVGEYYNGRRYIGVANAAFDERYKTNKGYGDYLSVSIIHAFVHSGGIDGRKQTFWEWWNDESTTTNDLSHLGQQYRDILKHCTKEQGSKHM